MVWKDIQEKSDPDMYFWYVPTLISSIIHFLPDIFRVKISSLILLVFRLNMFFASLLLLHLSPTYYSIRRERQSRALNALITGSQVPLPHLSIVAPEIILTVIKIANWNGLKVHTYDAQTRKISMTYYADQTFLNKCQTPTWFSLLSFYGLT